jgi:hypothetical protein
MTSPLTKPVSGIISVAATATDDTAVSGVQFLLDGTPLGPELPGGIGRVLEVVGHHDNLERWTLPDRDCT